MASEYFIFFHILFTFTMLAGVGAGTVVWVKAEEPSTNVSAVAVLAHLGWVAQLIAMPSAGLSGIFGVLAASREHIPLTGGPHDWWIVVSYAALVLVVALELAILFPHWMKTEKIGFRAAATGQKTPALLDRLYWPVLWVAQVAVPLLVIFLLVLELFRPF